MIKHALACAVGLMSQVALAADFSDTVLAYRYGEAFTEPARPDHISKHILTLGHLSGGSTGLHLVSLEGRYSDGKDPKKGSSDGATEYLVTYRWQLPAALVLDKPLAAGPVRDVALGVGLDWTTKNTLFAPQKRALMLGPVIKFSVPGYLDLGVLWYSERNHKGIPFTPHPNHRFDGTWLINVMWGIPFQVGRTPAVFQGLFNRLGDKGLDFNDRPSAGETLLRTNVLFDLGQALGYGKRRFMAGIGYEWWRNKYGTPAGVGTFTRTPTLNLETHF
jgi:hypothetical protein